MKISRLFYCLVFALAAPVLSAQTFKMLADNWSPFTDEKGTSPGYMTEIANAVAAKAGYTVNYEMIPWSRAVSDVKEGRADLLLAVLGDQVKAEGLVACEEPFAYTTYDFFTAKSSTWNYKDISSLEGQTLGIIQDYVYGDQLDPYILKYSKDEARVSYSTGEIPIQTSIKKLVAGRVSIVVDDRTVVMWHARKLGMEDKIRMAGSSGQPLPVFMAVSPKLANAKEVAAKFSTTLKEFKKTPEYAKILAKYGVAAQ